MLGVTTIGSHSHIGSQALGDRHRLVYVFSWQWSAKRLSTHQLSYASAGVYDTFPASCPRCDSPVGSNLESLRAVARSLLNEPVRIQSVLHDARTLRKAGFLG